MKRQNGNSHVVAVYGTLRNGKRPTGTVYGGRMMFPGHERFPAWLHPAIEPKPATVEIAEVDGDTLASWDVREGTAGGMYVRRLVPIVLDAANGQWCEAWIYAAGPRLLQGQKS